MSKFCVYLGSRDGRDPQFLAAARRFGETLGRRGHTLVYGGARIGMMGALAEATMAAGGKAIGVMPDHLVEREQAHHGLTELIRVRNMHERKSSMAGHADAFVVLPGGIGTLEEFFEAWTWHYLGLHDKPIGVLDTAGFYAPLLSFLDSTVEHGFLNGRTRAELIDAAEPEALLDVLEARLAMPR
ncbi:TIGR00730 family Rossman fold protein [Halomonas urumqiensis]|uniref:Cytokinin riboside 5'-monophosphate phosphoribohydrolase n=1 Tax=Halomonas urumqiensis TaxID=1684789 RepID=A0A2N7UN34_9GAMM|nr:TIGR00730 family Rossman fold protein [Halomonas urumqiensis]PMR81847.1 TIGR00730 family Rossman fold protein [Halomonas urumqiensis]PTB01493.1 TIGR00730 family Rossman fold protein [Halomonas urumqiensis]GHE22428.1 cytokinin riboside 5'-monophosphate phosphoribohydrolase [Halomonas urumqiensis]